MIVGPLKKMDQLRNSRHKRGRRASALNKLDLRSHATSKSILQ